MYFRVSNRNIPHQRSVFRDSDMINISSHLCKNSFGGYISLLFNFYFANFRFRQKVKIPSAIIKYYSRHAVIIQMHVPMYISICIYICTYTMMYNPASIHIYMSLWFHCDSIYIFLNFLIGFHTWRLQYLNGPETSRVFCLTEVWVLA